MASMRALAIGLVTCAMVFAAASCNSNNSNVRVEGEVEQGAARVETVSVVEAVAPSGMPQGDATERAAVVGRLAMERKASHRDVLRAALKDEAPLVRRHAIYGLQRLGDVDSAPAIAAAALGDDDRAVRRTAVVALGRLPGKASAAALVEALKDEDIIVRGDALLALGRLGDESTQGSIVEAMQDRRLWMELDMWTQVPLLRSVALPHFTDRRIIPLLHALLDSRDWDRPAFRQNTPEERFRRGLLVANAAADVLAVKFGDAKGEDLLIEGLGADDYMQQRSAYALGRIGSKKAVPALLKMLEGEWVTNKLYAIGALGASGDASAVEALLALAESDSPRLRVAASKAINALGVEHVPQPLATPAATAPVIAPDDELMTPGGKRPPMFIALGVDDCANIDGLEAMLDIVETLDDYGQKVVFTMWVAPLAGDPTTRDLEKQVLLLQRLFDMGSEIAHHTLRHNPGGKFWTSQPKEMQLEAIDGATQWYRDNIVGFVRPFTYKGGGGASGTAIDPAFSRALLERQNFIYRGQRLPHANNFAWPATGGPYMIGVPLLDASAPPVKATIADGFFSDYPGSFNFEMDEGLAMYKANFDFRYNHPLRPIMGINAFHDWGFQFYGHPSHRNQAALLKAFLMDVLVHNRDKYPGVHSVTFRQVVEYVASEGDLEHTLKVGNCQDSRNPVKPKLE